MVTALLCSGFGCFCTLAENLKIKWSFLALPALQGSALKLFLLPHRWSFLQVTLYFCFLCSIHSIRSCKANVYSPASQAELRTAQELSEWFWLQGLLSASQVPVPPRVQYLSLLLWRPSPRM